MNRFSATRHGRRRKIGIGKGLCTIVDGFNYSRVDERNWLPFRGRSKIEQWYARFGNTGQYLHEFLLGKVEGMTIDHINRNGLNNLEHNLRYATMQENTMNARPREKATSKYKGVCKRKESGRFRARIRLNGNLINIGSYKHEIDAAKAYDSKAKELFGEFAYLNIP